MLCLIDIIHNEPPALSANACRDCRKSSPPPSTKLSSETTKPAFPIREAASLAPKSGTLNNTSQLGRTEPCPPAANHLLMPSPP